jgi:SagB-type dehydrogenase family enzyme
MELPRHILDRVERLYSYHQRSKIMAMGSRFAPPAEAEYRPASYRVFQNAPKVALPTTLLDAPSGTLALLNAGQDAVPDSLRAPPQDLKTLASWLYYAGGEVKRVNGKTTTWTRTFAEADANFPFEIYVAIFGLHDAEPGLYHFCPREFALRRLRRGLATLMQIKKGRPDLEFIKTLPAAILIAGSYWRAVYRQGRRGYRTMLLDAGQMVQNLVMAGAGLGVQTITRLSMNDSTMRELIGCPLDEPLGTAECVLSMVAWADRAAEPLAVPPGSGAEVLPPIARPELSVKVLEDEGATEPLFVHHDCVAPGVAVRELRPPLTELSPLPPTFPAENVRLHTDARPGLPVRQAMLERRAVTRFAREHLARQDLLEVNHGAFRGGSFFPMFPDGPHVATVRPFWIIQEVAGFDAGIWYYHPPTDRWSVLHRGAYRREAKYIAGDREAFGESAAVCIMMANLHALMTQGLPDAYRLAHLEAGIAAQRLYLGATALKLAAISCADFYDDDVRAFLGLGKTGWEPLFLVAIGKPATAAMEALEQRARALGQVNLWKG